MGPLPQEKLWSNAAGRFGDALTQNWRRQITIEFMGMEAKMSVTSVQEEIEAATASLIKFKSIGVKNGLEALMWEAIYSPPEEPDRSLTLSSVHLSNFAAAREMAHDELSRVEELDITMALHLLKKQEARLLEKDRTFSLELQHLTHLVNGGAQSLLGDAMFKILDDVANKSGRLEEAESQLLDLKSDPCYTTNTLSAKDDWDTVYGAVTALLRGQCPSGFDNPEEDSLLHQLADR